MQFVICILKFQEQFDVDVLDFQIEFDGRYLAFFGLATIWATFLRNWALFANFLIAMLTLAKIPPIKKKDGCLSLKRLI